ncbi:InlB B-repeat-containing protein [Mesoterricola silvestris]|uniref:DUF11 domain-containing protein n=1 Tax=Mesoterricola silvestris TaxID=2927979 RepID=A0AA48KAK7_9BACT|nr:hypothetical protein [Mesoterricola silvestris]BDU74210.1 hypothetical protein METEAL_33840 [Mesoterricola silvestris]
MNLRTLLLGSLLALPVLGATWPAPGAWPNYASAPAGQKPVAWPASGAWRTYTSKGSSLTDPATADPSNGGTSPQSYVNVSSGAPDKSQPSVFWYYDGASQVVFYRFRLAAQPNTYATGPSAGSASTTDPWKSALWSVLIDINGDGFRDFAVQLNGSSGGPGTPVDRVSVIYSPTLSQSLDYATAGTGIYLVNQFASAFVASDGGGPIQNFHGTNSPDSTWPNGSAETVWDYGMTRSSLVPGSTSEYYLDFQVPLAMLDATAVGGPKVTPSTPMAFVFATSNSLNNPFQKDVVTSGDYVYLADPTQPAPFGDSISLGGGAAAPQPVVQSVGVGGCGPATLTASVTGAITCASGACATSITSVQFYSYADANGDGLANDGNPWVPVGTATTANSPIGTWTATWDTTTLPQGRYLVGVKATDASGNSTFSWFTAGDASGQDFANPASPGPLTALFTNTCGAPPPYATLSSSATGPVTAGAPVVFTVTVTNTSAAALTVTGITDALPAGFAYVSTGGGSLGAPATSPSGGASGLLSWTFAAAPVPAGGTRAFSFTATAPAASGTYSDGATVLASTGSLVTGLAQVSVGAPALALQKTASVTAALPGDTVTYTLAYANPSPVNVTGAVLADVLPTGLTFVSASGGGVYASGTRTVTWNLGAVPAGEGPDAVTLVTTVDSPFPSGAAIPLTSTATLTSVEASPATAAASVFVTASRPVLSVQVSTSPATVPANSTVTFTLSYANTGNATATGLVLTNPIPAGLSFVSASDGGTGGGGTVTWNLPDLAANATGSVTVTLAIPSGYAGANPLTDTASLAASGVAPVSNNFLLGVNQTGSVCNNYYFQTTVGNVGFDGSQYLTSTVSPVASDTGLAVKRTVSTTAYDPALNLGFYAPATSSDISLTGTLTTNFWVDRANGNTVYVRASVLDYNESTGARASLSTPTVFTLTGASKGQLTFNVPLSGTLQKGHRFLWLFEFAEKTAGKTDDIYLQFGGTAPNPISGGTVLAVSNGYFCYTAPANLVIDNQVNLLTANPGTALQYTILFSNTGQTSATSAQVVETLPAGVTFTSATLNGAGATPVSVSGQVYTFAVNSTGQAAGTVAGSGTGSLVVNAAVNSPLAAGITSLVNTASLSSLQTLATSDSTTTTVLRPAVTVAASADKALAGPGEIVTYTLTALNGGTGAASGVTLTDVLPVQSYYTYLAGSTTVNGAAAADSVSGGTLSLNLGALAAGASAQVAFQMKAGASGTFPATQTVLGNAATVSDAQTAGSRSSNTVNVTLNPLPNLRLAKAFVPAGPWAPGDAVACTLTVTNDGGADATGVQVADAVPASTGFVPGSLAFAGAPQTDASGDDAAWFDATGNRAVFTVGTLAPGTSLTLGYTFRIPKPMPAGSTPLSGTGTATASNTATKTASATGTVSAQATLGVVKEGPATSPYPGAVATAGASGTPTLQVDDASPFIVNQYVRVGGQTTRITAISGSTLNVNPAVNVASGDPVIGSLTYTLRYANSGTSDAASATLVDTLPAGALYVASTGGTYSAVPGTVTWNLGTLAAEAASSAQVTIFPAAVGNATDTAGLAATSAATATSSFTTGVGGLRLGLRTTTPTVILTGSDTATYVITVENTGASTATGVQVLDTLPSGFTYLSTTGVAGAVPATSPVPGDQAPAWAGFSIAPGATVTITFRAAIAAGLGAQTYQDEVSATTTSGTPVSVFDPLLTTAEDVTLLAAGTYFTLDASAAGGGSIAPSGSQAVAQGADATFTFTPVAGYHLADVTVDGSSAGTPATYTFPAVAANHTILATFAPDAYTLAYTAGAHGTLAGTTPQTVTLGGSGTPVTAVPDAGYQFIQWSDGLLTATRTDGSVAANLSVTASFAANTFTLAYTAGAHGTLTGTTPQTVTLGGTGTPVTAVPDAGYHFTQWSDGLLTASRTDGSVAASLSVTATFAANTFTLAYTAGAHGTLTGTTPQTVALGGTGTPVTAVPDAGYHFTQWSDGLLTATRTDGSVAANLSVTASFAANTFTLAYTAGAHGTLTGTTPQTVALGGTGTPVTAVPDAGYHFTQWSDGLLTASRTDGSVAANLSVTATFAANTFTLAYTAGAHGTLTGTTPQSVTLGGTGTLVTAVPDAGYHFTQWSDGLLTASRTDGSVAANLSVTAAFAPNTFMLAYTAGAHGTLTGTTPQTVALGGTGTPVTAVPDASYHFTQWSDGLLTASRTDGSVAAALSVTATFAPDTFTLAYTAGTHGTLTGTTPQTVALGGSGTPVTALPDTGYHFTQWSDGLLTASRTDGSVAANLAVTAQFDTDLLSVHSTSSGPGTVSPAGTQVFAYGTDATFTFIPGAGKRVGNVLVDGVALGPIPSYTFSRLTSNHVVSAVFDDGGRFTVLGVSGPEGSVGPAVTFANPGECVTVYVTPGRGFKVEDVQLDGVSLGAVDTYPVSNLAADHRVTATFSPETFTLDAVATGNGQILPASPQTVPYGQDQVFHFLPGAGQGVVDVLLDGRSLGPMTDYTLRSCQANHHLQVIFSGNP